MEANYPHDMDANQFPRDMDAHRPRDMDVRQFGGILFGVRDEGNAVNAGVHERGSIDLAPQKAWLPNEAVYAYFKKCLFKQFASIDDSEKWTARVTQWP